MFEENAVLTFYVTGAKYVLMELTKYTQIFIFQHTARTNNVRRFSAYIEIQLKYGVVVKTTIIDEK